MSSYCIKPKGQSVRHDGTRACAPPLRVGHAAADRTVWCGTMSRRRFLSLFILIASAVSRSYCGLYRSSLCHDGDRYVCCSFLLLPFSLFGLTLSLDNPQDVQHGGNADLQVHLTRKGFCPCGSVKIILLFTESFYRSFLQNESDRAAGKRQIDARLTSTCAARRQYGDFP